MKKCPKTLSLVLMTALTLSSAGCSNEQADDFQVFNSVGECTNSNAYTEQECKEMFSAAVAQTPRFTSKEQCEQQFGVGNCGDEPANTTSPGMQAIQDLRQAGTPANEANEQIASANTNATQQRRSSWMPILAGYMMGRYMGGGGYMQGSQPLFKDSNAAGNNAKSYRTPTGDAVRPDAKGKVTNPGSSIRKGFASTAKPTMARSGSGSRGGFFGGSGGS